MKGHLRKRGRESWQASVYLGRDDSGKKRYLRRTVRGSRRDAEAELARLVVEVSEGRHVAAAPIPFGELLDRWLELKALTVAATTTEGYRFVTERYLRPRLGERNVASIRAMELDRLYAELFASGGEDGRPLSARTVRICHTVVRQALEQARKWGIVARSVARDATPPRQTRSEVTPPSVDEVRRLLEAASDWDPDFGVFLWVLTATGCRRGEALALRWSDVDLDAGELVIRRSVAQVDGGEPFEKDTKTHQARRVALDDATVARLRDHRRRCREVALALGVHLPHDAFLFSEAGDFSRPWRPDVATNWFGRLRAQVGLAGVRLHDLRHFMATVLGAAGTPIATISARLGHRDKATTLDIYSHALPAMDRVAAEHMAEVLTGHEGHPRSAGALHESDA